MSRFLRPLGPHRLLRPFDPHKVQAAARSWQSGTTRTLIGLTRTSHRATSLSGSLVFLFWFPAATATLSLVAGDAQAQRRPCAPNRVYNIINQNNGKVIGVTG
jgi:hypothetical protein